jgi:uncharacterized membrane protein
MPKIFVYIIGLVPVAFGQRWLRDMVGDVFAVLLILLYLAALRVLIELFAKKNDRNSDHTAD